MNFKNRHLKIMSNTLKKYFRLAPNFHPNSFLRCTNTILGAIFPKRKNAETLRPQRFSIINTVLSTAQSPIQILAVYIKL